MGFNLIKEFLIDLNQSTTRSNINADLRLIFLYKVKFHDNTP